MRAQTPAEGILTMSQHDHCVTYKVPCTCGCEDEILFDVETDIDTNIITAHLYAKTKSNYWRTRVQVTYNEWWLLLAAKLWYNDWANRISVAWTSLTKGYVETETYVLLSKQQALNLSSTLKKAISNLSR